MKKIAQIILAVVIVALVYVIYDQISTPIRFEQEMKAKKAQVIDRIKDIRTAQRAFKSKYQRFTGSFDTLASFILNDSLELERKIVDEDDSVGMAMEEDEQEERREIHGSRYRHHLLAQTPFASGRRGPALHPHHRQAGSVHHGSRFGRRIERDGAHRGVPRAVQNVPRHGGLPSGGDKPDRRRAEQLQPLSRRQVRINGFR